MYGSNAASKRIHREIDHLRGNPEVKSYFRYETSEYSKTNGLCHIYGYILPRPEPYSLGSFRIRITLPREFPFKIPQIQLLTYIYHPRICGVPSDNHQSEACPCCILENGWRPCSRISDVIKAFVDSIDHPIRNTSQICGGDSSIMCVYIRDRVQYESTALQMVKRYAYPPGPLFSLKFAARTMIRNQLCYDSTKIKQLLLPKYLKEYLIK